MENMTAEQIIEKMQEAELTTWNDWRRAVEIYGESSGYTHKMELRHEAINNLMKEIGITCVDEIVRIPFEN